MIELDPLITGLPDEKDPLAGGSKGVVTNEEASLVNDNQYTVNPPLTQESTIADVQEELNVPEYERHEPTFFAMIPKMAQMDLAPIELALYCNLKQTARDGGVVTKSNKTLAFECHMSVASVKRARKSLEEKGYIRVEHRLDTNGYQYQTNIITIRDVWAMNHHRFETQREFVTGVVHTEPGVVHTEPGGGSHRTPSNNYKSKNQSTKKDSAPRKRDAVFDAVAQFVFHLGDGPVDKTLGGRVAKVSTWLKKTHPDVKPEQIRDFAQKHGQYTPLDVTKFAEQWTRDHVVQKSEPTIPERAGYIRVDMPGMGWVYQPVAEAAS